MDILDNKDNFNKAFIYFNDKYLNRTDKTNNEIDYLALTWFISNLYDAKNNDGTIDILKDCDTIHYAAKVLQVSFDFENNNHLHCSIKIRENDLVDIVDFNILKFIPHDNFNIYRYYINLSDDLIPIRITIDPKTNRNCFSTL